jgi:hypothetical protein
MIVIGIDPGKNGGIVSINDVLRIITLKMPPTPRDVYDYLDSLAGNDAYAFTEQVHAGPKMASSAAFKFGQNVGELRMALLALNIPIHYVTPQKWQREFGLLSKGRGLGQGDTAKKNRNKAKAQELFPEIKLTLATCDALLIAEYGRRTLAARN